MQFTDKEVIKWIDRLKCPEVRESLEEYPEDEREGRSDIQVFADEVSYGISCFNEEGHAMCDDLRDSQELIRVTKNGKEFPWGYFGYSFNRPMLSKDIDRIKWMVKDSQETVSEYRQLCYRMKKLHERGIYGYWEGR